MKIHSKEELDINKTSPRLLLITIFIFLFVTVFPVAAQSVTTINFDDLPTYTYLDLNHYQSQGVTFVGDLYVFEGSTSYPSHSGSNCVGVISPSNEIRVNFASPVSNVGFYYTAYIQPLTFTAYDSNGVQIGQAIGAMSLQNNGNPDFTDTYISIDTQEIAYITIDGFSSSLSGSGGYFVIDDLSFTSGSSSIPEFPSIVLPVAAILGIVVIFGRRKNMV